MKVIEIGKSSREIGIKMGVKGFEVERPKGGNYRTEFDSQNLQYECS